MDTENKSPQPEKAPISPVLLTSKLVLLGLNLLMAVIYFIADPSADLAGWLLLLAIQGALFLRVLRGDPETAAAIFLPSVILADVCSLLALRWQDVLEIFKDHHLSMDFFRQSPPITWGVLAVGLALVLLFRDKEKFAWLKALGGGLIATFLTFQSYVLDFDFHVMSSSSFPEEFLVAVPVVAVLWACLIQFITYTDPKYRKGANHIGLTLFLLFFFFFILARDYTMQLMVLRISDLLTWANVLFSWPMVILFAILGLGGACALWFFHKKSFSTDGMACAAGAFVLLAFRFVASFPSTGATLLLAALLVGTMSWVHNTDAGRGTLHIPAPCYLPVQFVAFLLLVLLLHWGHWMSAAVLAVFAVLFYAIHTRSVDTVGTNTYWIILHAAIVCFAAAWICQGAFLPAALMMLCTLLAVAVTATLLLGRTHPGGQLPPNWVQPAVCGILALLCVLAVLHI